MSEDLGTRIGKFEKNESSLTKLEVMSGEGINNAFIERIAAALPSNTHCTELLLKGCNVSTDNAKTLAAGLAANGALKKIDLESNRIDPAGIVALVTALRDNQSLTEVRFQNQKSQFGNDAETAIADMMEVNTFIEKIPLTLKNGGARVRVNKYETRNRDYNRRRRKGETIPGVPAGNAASSSTPAATAAKPVAAAAAAPAASAAPSTAAADAKKKAEEEAKKKAEDDAAAKKKAEADAAAKKKTEDDAAAAKKKAEDDAAAAAKKKAEEDAKKKAAAPAPAAAAPAASAGASADEQKAATLLSSKADAILARIDAVLNKIGA